MQTFRAPDIVLETIRRTVLVTDARNSSKAYFSEKADEALMRIERDRALFAQIAALHGGEEARDRGDGSMFVFCDPSEALRAAMAMQSEIARLNAELPPESLKLVHRMGMHLGEIKLVTTYTSLRGVESVRRKLSGDIVVTAARLEAICHPGEVCLSNEVYRLVRGSIDHEFRFLDSTLKGFDRPVRVWSTRLDREWARPLTAEEEMGKQRRKEERRLRERWESEQREKARRQKAVRLLVPVAALSLAFAGVRIALTNPTVSRRVDRAQRELLGYIGVSPPPATTVAVGPAEPEERFEILPVDPEPAQAAWKAPRKSRPRSDPDAKAKARARIAATIRDYVSKGDFEGALSALRDLPGTPEGSGHAQQDAERLAEAKGWLIERFASGVEPIGCLPGKPIRHIEKLTTVDDEAVRGTNAEGFEITIYWSEITPQELYNVISTATPKGDEVVHNPQECATSLTGLRRAAGL